MDAELTLLQLLQVIDEHIEDYELFAPGEALKANTDLLLHYLNHTNSLAPNDKKLTDQLTKVKTLLSKKDAKDKYSLETIAYTQFLIALAELETDRIPYS